MWYLPKEPYEPWNIEESNFPTKGSIEKQAEFLLNYASLAPSTFNVQPWNISINKNKIMIYPDYSRCLRTSDEDNRFLYVSLGCFLKNLELAARSFGFEISKKIFQDNDKSNIEVKINKSTGKINNSILLALKNRLTNRNPYILKKQIPKEFVEEIHKIAANNDLEIAFVTDQNEKNKVMRLVEKGDYDIWGKKDFKEEHLKWIRNNLTKQHDGMPAFTVGIPLILSFFAELAIKKLKYAKIQSKKNQRLLSTTPYFGFILSKNHNQGTWIKVGEVLEEIWVKATAIGVSLAPSVQIIAVEKLLPETKKVLNTKLRPQFFFRLGYATKSSYHSPRRGVKEILKQV